MQLLDGRETKRLIRAYLASGEWWTVLDPQGLGFLETVEEACYPPGAGNEDFHLVMLTVPGTRGLLGLAFAKKSRMDLAQAAEMLGRHGVQATADELERRDVPCSVGTPPMATGCSPPCWTG